MGGEQFLIHAQKYCSNNTRFFLVSGAILPEDTREHLSELAEHLIEKPFSKKDILQIMSQPPTKKAA